MDYTPPVLTAARALPQAALPGDTSITVTRSAPISAMATALVPLEPSRLTTLLPAIMEVLCVSVCYVCVVCVGVKRPSAPQQLAAGSKKASGVHQRATVLMIDTA